MKTRTLLTSLAAVLFVAMLLPRAQAQTSWIKHPGNPVIDLGTSGEWDDDGTSAGPVLFDGTSYRMWYLGYDATAGWRTGYATSDDGITWTKDANNPVLDVGSADSWDDSRAAAWTVLLINTTYHMWYGGYDGSTHRIGYATSDDGTTWTKYANNPVLDVGPAGSWDDTHIQTPTVYFDGSTYRMWYMGADQDSAWIGHATSDDGVTWTKYDQNPVLVMGPPDSWDDRWLETTSIVYHNTTYHMWYTGYDGSTRRIGYATSDDGVIWTKYANNPVLDVGTGGSWDDIHIVGSNAFIFNGTIYHMWYSGYNGSNYRMGYATSTPVAIDDPSSSMPASFSLRQNYPNPFNPASTILYEMPQASEVSLIVYDILGREVAELVDTQMESGYHQVMWHGRDGNGLEVPSGIYIARLVTAEYSKAIKMVLLK
jgi:predicted GH43/DUF377 family glycosyl hydrolase